MHRIARPVALLAVSLAFSSLNCASPVDDSPGFGQPRWATVDRKIGPADPNEALTLQVHLRLRDELAALTELEQLSNPENDRYAHYLTTEEFNAKYAPDERDAAAVRAHLESNGLRVTYVPDNRAYLSAEGTVAQVERAFDTELASYRVGSAIRRAPERPLRLPAEVGARVLAVLGVSTPVVMKPHNVTVGGLQPFGVNPDATTTTPSCSSYYGQLADSTDPAYGPGWSPLSYAPCGYKPPQVRQAYGFDDAVAWGIDGTGVSVAIVDAYESPTLLQDAQQYATNNDPTHPLLATQFSAQMAPGTPPPKPQTSWYGEQTLDVEAVHTMAPGANIVYVGAQTANDQDLIAAINLIVSQKLATIVSNSYGSTEADGGDFDAWHQVAVAAGLQGIGLYFASGDNGDESVNDDGSIGTPSADFPASLDVATAVGGTSLAVREDGQREFELGWESGVSRLENVVPDGGAADAGTETWVPAPPGSFVYGSGGGISTIYAQPSWQRLLVPPHLAWSNGKSPMRVIPDVAMLGNPDTGFVVGQTSTRTKVYRESVIGGTSLATPLYAGTMALAQEHAGRTLGFANPLLYRAYWLLAFRDVAPSWFPKATAVAQGVVVTFDFPGLSIHTDYGYDDVTGLGTPNGLWFLGATQWIRVAPPSEPSPIN